MASAIVLLLLFLTSFGTAIALAVWMTILLLCVGYGAYLACVLKHETDRPATIVVIVSLVSILALNIVLAIVTYGAGEPGGADSLGLVLMWVFNILVVVSGVCFEAGYFMAQSKKIYLVDQDEKLIVLTVCAGGRAFVRDIENLSNGVCSVGEGLRFVPMEELSSCTWCKVVLKGIR